MSIPHQSSIIPRFHQCDQLLQLFCCDGKAAKFLQKGNNLTWKWRRKKKKKSSLQIVVLYVLYWVKMCKKCLDWQIIPITLCCLIHHVGVVCSFICEAHVKYSLWSLRGCGLLNYMLSTCQEFSLASCGCGLVTYLWSTCLYSLWYNSARESNLLTNLYRGMSTIPFCQWFCLCFLMMLTRNCLTTIQEYQL